MDNSSGNSQLHVPGISIECIPYETCEARSTEVVWTYNEKDEMIGCPPAEALVVLRGGKGLEEEDMG